MNHISIYDGHWSSFFLYIVHYSGVVDLIYNPLKTKLLKGAEEKGCKVLSGADMLVYQGAESLRIWLGVEPPVDVMKKALIDNLS